MMDSTMTISRTELARNTRQTVERVRRGETILVKSFGEEQIAMLDIHDYRLLRAVANYKARPQAPVAHQEEAPAGLDDARVEEAWNQQGPQAAWDLVIHAYLDGDISLGRAAQLLGLNRFDLQARFHRLGLPLRSGPEDAAEALADLQALEG